MEITSDFAADPAGAPLTTVTVRVGPADDPGGRIARLAETGRLEAFLRCYARPLDLGAAAGADDALRLLSDFAYVTAMCAARLEAMQVAVRDQWGFGWDAIAAAARSRRSTIRGQVGTARARFAERGIWYDRSGVHRGGRPA